MRSDFWLQRWHEGRIGFHREAPMPLLLQYWPTLELPVGSRVLVPLAGKSLDMLWLAAQGYHVLGVELSPLAVQQFFEENQLTAKVHESPLGLHHVAGKIEIIQGDVFTLDDATLATCAAVYDRAAIIALPAPMRARYAKDLYARLPAGCLGLMITLEYPQQEMDGPPFSVDAKQLGELLEKAWQIQQLERRDILAAQPDFSEGGVTSLHTGIYQLQRRRAD